MDTRIIILQVHEPTESNSSFGNYAIAVDFQYLDGFKANTFKYAMTKKEATELYISLLKKISKVISMFDF
jgi:hypothetical protein